MPLAQGKARGALVLVAVLALSCTPQATGPERLTSPTADGGRGLAECPWLGFWQRDTTVFGSAWIRGWSDSTINAYVRVGRWTQGLSYGRDSGDHLWIGMVYDLHVEPDSSMTSKLVWTDAPDSLLPLVAEMRGRFSLADSSVVGEMLDSTQTMVPVWIVEPAWRIDLRCSSAVLDPLSASRREQDRLRRVSR